MLDEQIVNILLKYKDENFQEIANINNSINSIKGELESVFEYVSNEFSKELFDLNVTKENDTFLQDARCLKEYYQKFDTFLIPVNNKESASKNNNNSNNGETIQIPKDPDESLELYLTPDEVCPCCHASMNNVKDYYYNSSEKIINKSQFLNVMFVIKSMSLSEALKGFKTILNIQILFYI